MQGTKDIGEVTSELPAVERVSGEGRTLCSRNTLELGGEFCLAAGNQSEGPGSVSDSEENRIIRGGVACVQGGYQIHASLDSGFADRRS